MAGCTRPQPKHDFSPFFGPNNWRESLYRREVFYGGCNSYKAEIYNFYYIY